MKTKIKILGGIIFGLVIGSCNLKTSDNTESNADSNIAISNSANSITACQHASKIYWVGSKPTGEHTGIIKIKQGNYFIDDDELLGGEFVIDMNSIINIDVDNQERNEKIVNHLKSDDFFSVDSFPEGKFVITDVEEIQNDQFSHQVTGNLTLKAITKQISFKAHIKIGDGVVSATSEEFSLDRTKWGINYKSKSVFNELKDKFINDEFKVKIEAHSM